MNILHVGKYYPPFSGGIENFMSALAIAQQTAGQKVYALVHNHCKSIWAQVEQNNAVTIRRSGFWGRLSFVPISPLFWFDLAVTLRQAKPDVIHLHMPNLSVFWLLLFYSARSVPWVVHWHSDVLADKPTAFIRFFYPLYRIFERCLLKKASAVICTSETYKEQSKALEGYKDKVTVIPLGSEDLATKYSHKRKPGPVRLLMIGRLTYYKGHSVMLNALRKLPRDQVILDIVGEGELKDHIGSLCKDYGLNNVHLHGHVPPDQLTQMIDQSDLLCLPSIEKTEAFGLVILEAARRARPALVTDVPGSAMSWVVRNNLTGWVVPAGSADAIAQVVSSVIEEPETSRVMGNEARRRFEREFSLVSVSNKTTELYRKVIAAART